MIRQQIVKTFCIPFLLIALITSCDKKEEIIRPDIQIDKVIVNNEGEFSFADSLTYLVSDASQYEMTIQAHPNDVDLYYANSSNDFVKLTDDWIVIDSNLTPLMFYFQNQEDHNRTEVQQLDFGFGIDDMIITVTVYPNPFVDNVTYRIENNNIRGAYKLNIFNYWGQLLVEEEGYLTTDKTDKMIDLSHLDLGAYIVKFDFGNTIRTQIIIKQ